MLPRDYDPHAREYGYHHSWSIPTDNPPYATRFPLQKLVSYGAQNNNNSNTGLDYSEEGKGSKYSEKVSNIPGYFLG